MRDMTSIFIAAGGLFSIMTFIHFFVDWICQSHSEAMAKHNNWKVRAKHCLVYVCGFIPFLLFVKLSWLNIFISLNILFWSHFLEDTYLPVFLWAKYIRKPPEMTKFRQGQQHILYDENVGGLTYAYDVSPPDPKAGFVEFISTPLGKILMIVVDQIIHLTFLFPIIYLILSS